MKKLTLDQRFMIAGIGALILLFVPSFLLHGWIGLLYPPLVFVLAFVIGYPIWKWIEKGDP
jgi:hypothetical protein